MATNDIAGVLSAAFRQLSDALHQASVACKDLEYTVPILARAAGPSASAIPPATAAADAAADKKKRKRDPNEPRRPPSGYLLFTADVREGVQKANADMKPADVMSKLASMWKDLTDAQKRPYEQKAKKAKEEYMVEREKYEADHPELAKKRKRVSAPKPQSKTLPSPTASPIVDGHAPATPATKVSAKDAKQSSKKEKAPKSDRKSSAKEKEKEKEKEKDDKKRRRKSEGKSK